MAFLSGHRVGQFWQRSSGDLCPRLNGPARCRTPSTYLSTKQDPPLPLHDRAHLRRDPPAGQGDRTAPRRTDLRRCGVGSARPSQPGLAGCGHDPRRRPLSYRSCAASRSDHPPSRRSPPAPTQPSQRRVTSSTMSLRSSSFTRLLGGHDGGFLATIRATRGLPIGRGWPASRPSKDNHARSLGPAFDPGCRLRRISASRGITPRS